MFRRDIVTMRASGLIVPCVFGVWLVGCATSAQLKQVTPSVVVEVQEEAQVAPEAPPKASPTEVAEAQRLWERSQIAEEAGDTVGVRRLLRRLVRSSPLTEQAIDARIRLAEDALSRRDWSSAHGLVQSLNSEGPEGYARHRVIALAYEGQADYKKAAESWLAASQQTDDEQVRQKAIVGAAQDLYLGGYWRWRAQRGR